MARIDHLVLPVRDLDAAAAFYAGLGFTLSPRASHPWGTDNICIQLADRTYLEPIAVIRPGDIDPPRDAVFNQGAFVRDFLERREGFAMLAIEDADADTDAVRFAALGLTVHEPSGMERDQRLPDGSVVRMRFRTQFATDPSLRGEASVFGCYKDPAEAFWTPAYQAHENGVIGLCAVIIAAPDEAAGQALRAWSGLGAEHSLVSVDPGAATARFDGFVLRVRDLDALDPYMTKTGVEVDRTTAPLGGSDIDVLWLDAFGVRIGFTEA